MASRSESFRRLGSTFVAGGERYERLRPGYPDEAVAWLTEGVPVTGSAVDVGAGTGKLTAALVKRGLGVVAVDPSADMLAQVGQLLPGVETRVGSGEATGLPDDSADLVTYAQSWHWVEPHAGSAEAARLLRPGGRAGWVWNFMDVRVPWVEELAGIWHSVTGSEATDAARHTPVLSKEFGVVESMTVEWNQTMKIGDLADLVTTRSYYLDASPEVQDEIVAEVAVFLRRQFPEIGRAHV